MDRLPKDIRGIIYKYIFDHNYFKVMKQYHDVWLNDENLHYQYPNDYIYWFDREQCSWGPGQVANYRLLDIPRTDYRYIYKMRGECAKRTVSNELPTRYKYTGFPFIDYTRVEQFAPNHTIGANKPDQGYQHCTAEQTLSIPNLGTLTLQ